jgi:murein DD-endopeptidase MepM/ murein hydrolase activator NlpD
VDVSNLNIIGEAIRILDVVIPIEDYCKIDLSTGNLHLDVIDITDPLACQEYITSVLKENNAQVAYGGYLEKRNLYASDRFSVGNQRNIHLGMDFWCKAGTVVHAPIAGKVHSFKNNVDIGNYGPTIILAHQTGTSSFYTLYGHLALASLKDLYVGKEFKKGEILGALGTTDINVNYAPHLHFQIIDNIENYSGDYPGVCSDTNLDFYKKNCPDPNLLLKL